jgi:purine-binding chemotaxis protein CheW
MVAVRVRVGAERYALPAEHVPEVAELGTVTRVPGAPARILGVRNLRGEVLAVADLVQVLGSPPTGAASRLVVAEDGPLRAGLAVDAVEDVGELPPVTHRADSPLLSGAAMVGDDLVGLLDVPALLRACAVDDA